METTYLPVQLIFQGKTSAYLACAKPPLGWHVTCTHNHRAIEETKKIVVPYLTKKKAELKLANDQRALCIFDNFKGQLTDNVLQLLERYNIDIVFVPANCTDPLQPLDLSMNKPAKDFLRDKFQMWHSDQIFDQLQDDLSPVAEPVVKFPLNIMKPLVLQWMEDLEAYMLSHLNIIRSGF